MNWERIEQNVSLNDPETRFHFESFEGGTVRLCYRDWQNRGIAIHFFGVEHFSFGFLPPSEECEEGAFYRSANSSLIDRLNDCQQIGLSETIFHYLIGSNEGEWCEVVAASYTLVIEQ